MRLKQIVFLIGIFFCSVCVIAQQNNYSYLYIEGDKETPFYVKMEGQMMPRYGQHYAILSNLDKGITNIEILFQQNKYPAQIFKIKIPEAGARGMQLRKITDEQFALYDLQTGNYILSGNKPEDDNIYALENLNNKANAAEKATRKKDLEIVAAKKANEEKVAQQQQSENEIPKFKPETKKDNKVAKTETVKKENSTTNQEKNKGEVTRKQTEKSTAIKTAKTEPNNKPVKQKSGFIDNVSINNDGSEIVNGDSELPPNTDCKTVLSNEAFDNFHQRVANKSEDEDKIKMIGKNKKQCYTTAQVEQLLSTIKSQSGRLLVAKQLYAQTSNQESYHTLKSLFKSEYLQNKFLEIIK